MTRQANTPLLLWVCAAVCAHYMFAEGGDKVARIHDDHVALWSLASKVRERIRSQEQTFEVSSLDAVVKAEDDQPNAEQPPKPKPERAKAEDEKDKAKAEAPKPPPPKPEEPKKLLVVPSPNTPPPPPPPPMLDRRIAVKQHADKDQPDNPNAKFIADEANHVQEESVATQTSHDQDDPNPTPGGNHAGPKGTVGDSDRTKIADSDEHAGEKNRAPGEKGTEFEVRHEPGPTPAAQAHLQTPAPGKPSATPPTPAGGDGKATSAAANTPVPTQDLPGGPGPAAPEISPAAGGSWSFNPTRPGAGQGTANEAGAGATANRVTPPGRVSTQWLGLGGSPGPGQVNLNLSHTGVVATVGSDQLRKEREADGERRRSEHRGSWAASGFERWRSAIENYVSTVKPGNQTALNTAAVPFASYLTMMHNRIHPIFADTFLGSLESLPPSHPLSDKHLITSLEIVLTKDGRLQKMGVTRTSGITAFDIAALDSVQRASPFGPAPSAIVSADGNVYLHWEFHRNEVYACSTMNARPFLLNIPAKAPAPDPTVPPGTPPPTQERIPTDGETRHGFFTPAPALPITLRRAG